MTDYSTYTDDELNTIMFEMGTEMGARIARVQIPTQVLDLIDQYHIAAGDLTSLQTSINDKIAALQTS